MAERDSRLDTIAVLVALLGPTAAGMTPAFALFAALFALAAVVLGVLGFRQSRRHGRSVTIATLAILIGATVLLFGGAVLIWRHLLR